MTDNASSPMQADIVVVGAGVVGLTLSIALAQAGFAVMAIGPVARERNGRTVALLDGSVRFLTALGLWPALAGHAAPLSTMRIVDDTGSLFRGPPLAFGAAEIGLPAFGYNVENAELVGALESLARATPSLSRQAALLVSHKAGSARIIGSLADGGSVAARLLIAADGARSPAREAAGIAAHEQRYPQVALTMLLHHTAPHGNVSTEFHTREGPFTLVPMVPAADAPHRSSLVWVMAPQAAERRATLPPDALAREVEAQSRLLLGTIEVRGSVGRFPIRRLRADRLVGTRVALAGEAAHALPPIGAQGLNLSLRDAATLLDILTDARAAGRDPGSTAVLDTYARARSGDVALRGAGVHLLNSALLSPHLPIDAVRAAGMRMLGSVAPLRRAVMREGLRPQRDVPRLMRG